MTLQSERLDRLNKMLEEQPDDLFLKYALAMEKIGCEQFEDATTILGTIIDKDPNYTAAYYQLAVLHTKNNQVTEAIEMLQKGILTTSHKRTINEFKSLLEELEN